MVRIFIFALLFVIVYAENNLSAIDTKVINLIGENSYIRNKSFINKLFSSKDSFYKNGNLDIYKVISTLKNNGLLKLKFKAPQEFNAIFIAQTSPIFLLKAINQSLSYMGYSYWLPSEVEYIEDISKIKISLTTEHIIDPLIMLNELAKSGFASINIAQNTQNEWEYNLVLTDSKIPDSTFIANGNSLDISEVTGQYWLEVGAKGRLEVSTLNNKSFNPKIIFFDRNLNILDVQELSKRSSFNVSIINNTKFIKIKDSISDVNLKSGINVKLR
ncbi:hypothetical protein [Helicobacter sp. MIT 14-3879]|uniref:hypothetical protein n=1 Tax=Helicobacter sp. MIT 14-3879 TaxID=2040649 RepID=UPI000E1ED38F|nr:hypothetical protein [Helicobacter sp. MIT 14-3879]RDU63135.1 hypothetical protein CQA44_05710 [Helicobacter sp. MIT 14-3879]